MKKSLLFLVALIVASVTFNAQVFANGTVVEKYPVSQGVQYAQYTYGSKNNSINHLAVNLNNQYTKLTVGIPVPINTLMTTTAHANKNSAEGNRVVGAINANFYNMSDGYPIYLIAENNRIITPEVISDGSSYYVNQPYAFGVTKDGNGEIGRYNAEISIGYNGKTTPIDGFNVKRGTNEAIVYTPQYHSSKTPTNEFGMEFVVETDETITSTRFGKTYTGKVTKIRNNGDTTSSTIPRNGFVLSFSGSAWGDQFRSIQVGEEVSVSFAVDNPWKDAQYMMTSGPLLVMDGKKNISMSTSSSRASEVTARSAIAVSKDKKTVHLVTVDGGNGSGKGMSLSQFADYLVSLGVDRAINLDGGGSTTMGIRKYGSNNVVLANSPSGGSQRKVSAIIQAISTGTTGAAKNILVKRDSVSTMLIGSTVNLTPSYVLDEHYNPVSYKNTDFQVVSSNGLVTVNGLSYTAKAAGSDKVSVKIGNAVQTFDVKVVSAPSSIDLSGTFTIEPNAKTTLKATPKMSDGSELLYSSNQIKWSVDSEYGTISSYGTFTSNGKIGKATVTATIGDQSVSKQIEVKETFTGDVFAIDSFESIDNKKSSSTLAKAEPTLISSQKFGKDGKSSLQLTYDMTGNSSGTAAAYVNYSTPITLPSKPKKIGVWMYGNSGKTWVRGTVKDSNGTKHTINFTENAGQTWTGWKYIEANVDASISFPVSFESLYLVQPSVTLQSKGTVYFDKLQAVYNTSYVEPLFSDVPNNHAYRTEIKGLVDRGLISGYGDGSFKPGANLTRAHAAVLIVRALGLSTSSVSNPGYNDVSTSHAYYKEIAAITNAKIMSGSQGNFNPSGELTRVQMAKILVEAYKLTGSSTKTFSDVPTTHWGYDYVSTLAANGITSGYPDGTFGAKGTVTRQHFSAFLYRILTK